MDGCRVYRRVACCGVSTFPNVVLTGSHTHPLKEVTNVPLHIIVVAPPERETFFVSEVYNDHINRPAPRRKLLHLLPRGKVFDGLEEGVVFEMAELCTAGVWVHGTRIGDSRRCVRSW